MRYCSGCGKGLSDYDLRRRTCSEACKKESARVSNKLAQRRWRAARLGDFEATNPPESVAAYLADAHRLPRSVFPGVAAPVKPLPKPVEVVSTPSGTQTRCDHHVIRKVVSGHQWELYCRHCGADQTDLMLMEHARLKAADKESPIAEKTFEQIGEMDFDSIL